jgi:hypothetical protein
MLIFPNGGYFLQPSNNMTTSKTFMPTNFELYVNGSLKNFAINPDGGPLQKNAWYYFDFHFKVTSPTDFTIRVNGQQVLSMSPPVSPSVNELFMFGWQNGCGATTWGVDMWMDAFVLSSSPVHAPSEVWLCPTASETDMSHCAWQLQESIADTSESFIFRRSGNGVTIPPGTGYLKIRNQKQQLSPGIAITVP